MTSTIINYFFSNAECYIWIITSLAETFWGQESIKGEGTWCQRISAGFCVSCYIWVFPSFFYLKRVFSCFFLFTINFVSDQVSSPVLRNKNVEIKYFCVADIAFVDRADIKAYVGPPTLQARYEILRSCLQELLRTGILSYSQLQVFLIHYYIIELEFFSSSMRCCYDLVDLDRC